MWSLVDLKDPVTVRKIRNFFEAHLEDCITLYDNMFNPSSLYIGDYWFCESDDKKSIVGIAGVYPRFSEILLHCTHPEDLIGFEQPHSIVNNIKVISGPYDQVVRIVKLWNLDPKFLYQKALFHLKLNEDLCSPPEFFHKGYKVIQARDYDLPKLFKWQLERAGGDPDDIVYCVEHINNLHTQGRLYVLYRRKDDEPCAMAYISAQGKGTVQLAGVYVPIVHRAKGYSKILVAGVLERLRRMEVGDSESIIENVVLFTENQLAMKIYERVGFQLLEKMYGQFYPAWSIVTSNWNNKK